MTRTVASFIGAGVLLTAAYAAVGAQATRSVNEGIYTAEQATRGEPIYKEQCAACHGDNLEGSGPMPALAGNDFLTNWGTKTVGELFEKTHTTMPATAPGTLKAEDAADVVAYLLSVSKFPAGTTVLEPKMETLLQIKIEPPGAAGAPTAGTSGASPAPADPAAPAPAPAPVPAPAPAPAGPSKP
jgi:mono/diheme cytochrome c family protein